MINSLTSKLFEISSFLILEHYQVLNNFYKDDEVKLQPLRLNVFNVTGPIISKSLFSPSSKSDVLDIYKFYSLLQNSVCEFEIKSKLEWIILQDFKTSFSISLKLFVILKSI